MRKKTSLIIISILLLSLLASCGLTQTPEAENTAQNPDWDSILSDYYSEWVFSELSPGENQSVNYGLLKRPGDTLIIFLDGSSLSSVFGTKENGKWTNPGNAYMGETLFSEYSFLAMDKINVGIGQNHNGDENVTMYDTLDNRVAYTAQVIDSILSENEYEKVFIYGISEGALIAPLVYLNSEKKSSISGIIVQGVGAYSQLEGFNILKNKDIDMPEGWKQAYESTDEMAEKIESNPYSIEDLFFGLPYLRWATYGKYSPLDDFLKIDIPILLLHGKLDASSPVEGAQALKQEFDDSNKDNLTYIEYENMGHGAQNAEQAQRLNQDILGWIGKQ